MTFDLVQKLVIEDIKHAGETFSQIEEVDHKARTRVYRTIQLDFDTLGVPVQAITPASGRYVQEVHALLRTERPVISFIEFRDTCGSER